MTTTGKILILGATGNLARCAAESATADHPHLDLRLASSREEGRAELQQAFPNAEVVLADWYDEDSLRAAFQGVSKVLINVPDFTDETVVTPNIIRAVKAAGNVEQIVRFISLPLNFTGEEHTESQRASGMGEALHIVAKKQLDASGLPITYVNDTAWIMFNFRWLMADDIRSKRQLILPSHIDGNWRWVSEQDIGAVFAHILAAPAADHVGKEYRINPGPRISFPRVAEIIGDVIGSKVTYVDSDETIRVVFGDIYDKLMDYFSFAVTGFQDIPEIDPIPQMLGRPMTSLAAYIRQNKHLVA
jgi:NAD(P)H dehydrogenase (quinone)